ncbi:hypothetical protein DPMN_053385 [Dreissena polymorpha]|uniref:Uncharacterized protein n=1 Tax=Dreissena polymorpha TaxID=45954 RepID=A0A9D4HQN4_DREPO|nr:hypothetical protein DPMN_053385 [Dreissena polymorpha]
MRKEVRVDTPLSANKFALKEYVNSFSQGKEAVKHHKAKKEKMPTPTASTPTTKAELFSMMPADLACKQLREQSARLRPLRPNLAQAKFSPRKEMSDDVLVWEIEQMEAARKDY